jgi:membrane protease YdiL (CAAX protease family)
VVVRAREETAASAMLETAERRMSEAGRIGTGDTPPGSRPVLETVGVLAGVFLITIAYSVLRPAVVATRIVPLVILYELGLYVVLVGLVAVANKLNKRTLTEGLGFRLRPARKQVLIGLAIFAVTISFIIAPLLLGADRADVLSYKARNVYILLYYVIHSFFFVGFGEELVWRGYFLARAKEITGSGVWAVVLPALFFGLWHYPNGQNVAQVFVTAFIGVLYGFARLRVRDCSTLATGVAHGLHDSVIVILSYFLL